MVLERGAENVRGAEGLGTGSQSGRVQGVGNLSYSSFSDVWRKKETQ